ncbi:Crp/Fnr family transcriptional regulator [candidate division KSB1 bacterium]
MKRTPSSPEEGALDQLGGQELLGNFRTGERRKIAHFLSLRELAEGEALVSQGDLNPGLVLLLSGEVQLSHNDESNQTATWSLSECGQLIGEHGLVDPEPSLISAVATVPSRVLVLDQSGLSDLLDRHPKIGTKLLLNLSRFVGTRLRLTNERLGTGIEPT